jgi:acetylglutamate kinase
MKQALTVVKIGGNVVDDPTAMENFLHAFAHLPGPKLLVHGGGKIATRTAEQLGIATQMVEGRRITSEEMVKVIAMVYGGLVNKQLVAGLQALGCQALGLSGVDGNLLPASKRPVGAIDYGWVGDLHADAVNTPLLQLLLTGGITPVVAPMTHDGQGHLLNVNADTIAATLASSLSNGFEVTLVYCFEKPGVLRDADNPDTVIPILQPASFQALKTEGIIHSGMIPKLDNAFESLQKGVKKVVICPWEGLKNWNPAHTPGTLITL